MGTPTIQPVQPNGYHFLDFVAHVIYEALAENNWGQTRISLETAVARELKYPWEKEDAKSLEGLWKGRMITDDEGNCFTFPTSGRTLNYLFRDELRHICDYITQMGSGRTNLMTVYSVCELWYGINKYKMYDEFISLMRDWGLIE